MGRGSGALKGSSRDDTHLLLTEEADVWPICYWFAGYGVK